MAINPNFNDGVSQGSHPRGIVGQSNKSIITRINELETQRKDTGSLSRSILTSTSTEKLNNSPIIGQKERIRAAQEADLKPGLIKIIKLGGTGTSQVEAVIPLQDRSIIALVKVNINLVVGNQVIFGEGEANETTITTNTIAPVLAKYSPTGEFLWAKQILDYHGFSTADVKYLAAGFQSFYFVGSAYASNRTLLPGIEDITLNNSTTGFIIVKFDLNGNYLWHKLASGNSSSFGNHGVCDVNDNLYFCGGATSGTLTFFGNNYTSSSTNQNGFVGKISSDGETLYWFKVITHNARSRFRAVCLLNDGNIALTGDYRNTPNFGNGITIAPCSVNDDIYIVKLRSSDGTALWGNCVGSVNDEDAESIVSLKHENDNIIIGGIAGTSTKFPDGSIQTGSFIMALDIDGNFVWKKSYTSFHTKIRKIVPLYNNKILVCGYSSVSISLDGINLPSTDKVYAFFGVHDPDDATYLWGKQIDGNGTTFFSDAVVSTKGKIIFGGAIEDTTTFGIGEENETTITLPIPNIRVGVIAIYNQY